MKEKLDRYFIRTVQHIHRVQSRMLQLVTKSRGLQFNASGEETFELDEDTCRQLMFNVMKHDQSKFNEIQFRPYVELTNYYHQRKVCGNKAYDYPKGVREKVDAAIQDHYHKENHHPERNKGLAKKMSFLELTEVCCDLQAMADEFKEGSCVGYFESVWLKKQSENFYDDWDWEVTKGFMYEIIKEFEKHDKSDLAKAKDAFQFIFDEAMLAHQFSNDLKRDKMLKIEDKARQAIIDIENI